MSGELSDDEVLAELAKSEAMTIDELRADNLRLRKAAIDERRAYKALQASLQSWTRENDRLRAEAANAINESAKVRRIILAALDVEDPDA